MPRRLVFLALTFLALFFPVLPAAAADNRAGDNTVLITEIMDYLQEYHLSGPDRSVLTDSAIQGMLDGLNDPYAEYFKADEIQSFTDYLNGDLVGVGIEVRLGEKNPYVADVIPGTPAESAGIKPGDIIIAVNGEDTADKQLSDVVDSIRGPRGTDVSLTIKRGEQEINKVIKRADIHIPSVSSEMMQGNTGYIQISSFGSGTAREFDEAIKGLQDAGMKSLILDLRDNGGGYLNAAVDMLGNFLIKGSVVVSIVDKEGREEKIRTERNPSVGGLPVVVIVNDFTASASEIMAAALRDHGMAKILGSTTFGKGVVQNIIPLSTGGALKFTVFKYLTPSGSDIDKAGIKPNNYVFTESLQREVAWELLHPEDNPDLVFDLDKKTIELNGQILNIDTNIIEKQNVDYMPLRVVLESMLYEVKWENGVIKIESGGNVVKEFKPNDDSGLILENGTGYIPLDVIKGLNINLNKEGNRYQLIK